MLNNDSTLSMKQKMQKRRKRANNWYLGLSLLGMLIGLFWLFWIIATILYKGIGGLDWAFFTQSTPAANSSEGGMLNAIVGSVLLIFFATLIGTPIGIMAGIYLNEYGQNGLFSSVTRFVNDILLSAPSIVIGLFIYATIVIYTGHFSGIAGIFALALLQIPIIIKNTENMLNLVPKELKEAAYALGAPKWKIITSVILKASVSGILTGVLLAVARVAGETAPLLFTTLSNQFFSFDLSQPIANLPVVIYNFASQPDENLQKLAWAGILFMTLCILILNILARILFHEKK
ncbi:phosphate ABC transporter permease PstA [Neisseriaceae bacterium PsAf]|nr:phosphate ABC transporter permease PstA [Neisseriaceae bacterium PsAf]